MRTSTKDINKLKDAMTQFHAAGALNRVRRLRKDIEKINPRKGTVAWNRTQEASRHLERAERNLAFAEVAK